MVPLFLVCSTVQMQIVIFEVDFSEDKAYISANTHQCTNVFCAWATRQVGCHGEHQGKSERAVRSLKVPI